MTFLSLRPAALALAAAAALGAVARADRLFLTNGSTIECDVLRDTLQGVTYKSKAKSGEQVQSPEGVLRIEFTKVPSAIDSAEADVTDNNLESAADLFEQFAEGVLNGENRRDKQEWAPAYALRRAIEVNQSIASKDSLARVVTVADKLVARAADSRHVPFAYIAKAEALRDLGKNDEAAAAAVALKEVVESKSLHEAYKLEAALLEVQVNAGLRGQARRDRLIEIASQAGTAYPIVRNRARVAEAETYIEGDAKDFGKALKLYEGVVKDPKADAATLAGAYTGLGDCLFQQGVEKLKSGAPDALQTLKDATFAYLRVTVVYKDQSRYAPRAMYFAGRCFDLMGEDQKVNARKMYGAVISQYPGSNWAQEARNQRR
jgi:tetratricopeptide (TPR) repeat protein